MNAREIPKLSVIAKLAFGGKPRERNCNVRTYLLGWKQSCVLHLLEVLWVNNFMSVQLLSVIRLLSTAIAVRCGNAAGGYLAAAIVTDLLWYNGFPGVAVSEEHWYQSYTNSSGLSTAWKSLHQHMNFAVDILPISHANYLLWVIRTLYAYFVPKGCCTGGLILHPNYKWRQKQPRIPRIYCNKSYGL